MRAAANQLGATGAEHVAMALALRELTGLQTLNIGGMFLILPMLLLCLCLIFYRFEGGCDFGMSGVFESMVVVRDLVVTNVADNKLGATGAEHIGMALRELTGLQELVCHGMRCILMFLICLCFFFFCIEGGYDFGMSGAVESIVVVVGLNFL
jgi:hypothetical protein